MWDVGWVFEALKRDQYWATLSMVMILRAQLVEPLLHSVKGKCKAVPLQAWSGPEGSRKSRFPDYMTTAQDCGKVVSPRHRPPLPPGNTPGTHFC